MELSGHFFRLGRVRVLTGLNMAGVLLGLGFVWAGWGQIS